MNEPLKIWEILSEISTRVVPHLTRSVQGFLTGNEKYAERYERLAFVCFGQVHKMWEHRMNSVYPIKQKNQDSTDGVK